MSRYPLLFALAAAFVLPITGCLFDDASSPGSEPVVWETHAPAGFSYILAQSRQFGGEDVFSVTATPDSVIAVWSLSVEGFRGNYTRIDSAPVTENLQGYSIDTVLARHATLAGLEVPPDTLILVLDSEYGYPRELAWGYSEIADADGYVIIGDFVVIEP